MNLKQYTTMESRQSKCIATRTSYYVSSTACNETILFSSCHHVYPMHDTLTNTMQDNMIYKSMKHFIACSWPLINLFGSFKIDTLLINSSLYDTCNA